MTYAHKAEEGTKTETCESCWTRIIKRSLQIILALGLQDPNLTIFYLFFAKQHMPTHPHLAELLFDRSHDSHHLRNLLLWSVFGQQLSCAACCLGGCFHCWHFVLNFLSQIKIKNKKSQITTYGKEKDIVQV